jgi:GTP cyclohydrolase I
MKSVHCTFVCLVHQYCNMFHEQLSSHNVFVKVEELKQCTDTRGWKKAYQVLDDTNTKNVLHTKKNNGKCYSATYEWSPQLKRAVCT